MDEVLIGSWFDNNWRFWKLSRLLLFVKVYLCVSLLFVGLNYDALETLRRRACWSKTCDLKFRRNFVANVTFHRE